MALSACGGDAAPPAEAPASVAAEGEGAPLPVGDHTRCAWIGQDTYEKGVATYLANADFFEALHPKWYELAPGGAIRTFKNAGDRRLVDGAARHGTLLMPMIADRGVEDLRAMLADEATRQAHVAALVALVVDNDWDGLDLDYEHLWSAADRPAYQAFVGDLAGRLHDAGKRLSVAVPGLVGPKKQAAYDYVFLAATVDVVHIMGYDFHTTGTHAGPVAPLGWVQAVTTYAASVAPERFVLAVPNYGVTATWYGDSQASVRACAAADETTTDHMASCSYGHYAAGRAPNCRVVGGQPLFFDDLESLKEKIGAAHDAGLAGVSYWTVGGEPEGFFDMVRSYY